MTALALVADPMRRVVDALRSRGLTPKGGDREWTSDCPVHDAPRGTLTVTRLQDGSARVRCRAGCTSDAILAALGLTRADLRPGAVPTAPGEGGPATPSPVLAREDAEQQVLGACLVEPDALVRCRTIVQPTDFGWLTHAEIFDACCALADAGTPIDAVSVAAALERRGTLAFVGGPDYLGFLTEAVGWIGNADAYAALVVDAAQRRRIIAAAQRAVAAAQDPSTGLAAITTALTADVAATSQPAGLASRFTVLTDLELEAAPPPVWLWDGLLPLGALAALVGPPGAGKSFVALDLAASIAAGLKPLGRSVLAGSVLYLAAEGTAGLPQRLSAWKHAHSLAGTTVPLAFVTQSLNLFAPGDEQHAIRACAALAARCPDAPVRLVIIDTLARSMPGADENSAKDVGLVIEHAERIRRATGATVLLVHHTAKGSDVERGSSALRGAMDTVLAVRADDPDAPAGTKMLIVDKQKDGAPAEPIVFQLEAVAARGAHGPIESCRVILSASGWTDAPEESGPLTRTQLEALRVLRDCFGTLGATATEWAESTGLPRKTFYRSRAALVRLGLVTDGHGRGSRYAITAGGHTTLAAPGKALGVIGVNSVSSTATPRGESPGPLRAGGSPHPSRRVAGAVTLTPTRNGAVAASTNGHRSAPPDEDIWRPHRRGGIAPLPPEPPDRLPYRDIADDEEPTW